MTSPKYRSFCAGLMDFICFAARLKCYYEGGVGLQKTLNHAGPGAKRSMSMSRPGDSDSEDDEDDEPNVDIKHDDPDVSAREDTEESATEADLESHRDEEDGGVRLSNGVSGHGCDDEPDEHGEDEDDDDGDDHSSSDGQDDEDGDEDEDGHDDDGDDHDDPEGDHGLVEENEKGFSGVGDDDVDLLGENKRELGKQRAESTDDADETLQEDLIEDTPRQVDGAAEVGFEDGVPEADLGMVMSDSEIIGENSEPCEGAESDPTRTSSSDTEASCTVPPSFPSSLASEMGEDPPKDSVGMVSVASVSKAISAAVKAATTPGVTVLQDGSEEGKRSSEGKPFPTE